MLKVVSLTSVPACEALTTVRVRALPPLARETPLAPSCPTEVTGSVFAREMLVFVPVPGMSWSDLDTSGSALPPGMSSGAFLPFPRFG